MEQKNPRKTGNFGRHSDGMGMGADETDNRPNRGLSRGDAGCKG